MRRRIVDLVLSAGPYTAAVVVIAAIVGLTVCGCGASAVSVHARAATATAGTLAAAGTVVDQARSDALDRVEREHPTDPEHDAALLEEAARWRPVGAALDTARGTLLTWIAAVEAAHAAGGGEDLLRALIPIAVRLALLYDEIARLAGELGAAVPALPASVRSLALGAASGR